MNKQKLNKYQKDFELLENMPVSSADMTMVIEALLEEPNNPVNLEDTKSNETK